MGCKRCNVKVLHMHALLQCTIYSHPLGCVCCLCCAAYLPYQAISSLDSIRQFSHQFFTDDICPCSALTLSWALRTPGRAARARNPRRAHSFDTLPNQPCYALDGTRGCDATQERPRLRGSLLLLPRLPMIRRAMPMATESALQQLPRDSTFPRTSTLYQATSPLSGGRAVSFRWPFVTEAVRGISGRVYRHGGRRNDAYCFLRFLL